MEMTWKRIKEPFACFISEEQLGVRIIAGGRGGRSSCKKSGEQAQIALDRIWAESIGLACDGKTELLSLNLFPSQETEMELHPSNALENVIFFFSLFLPLDTGQDAVVSSLLTLGILELLALICRSADTRIVPEIKGSFL